jgi:DDE superfamily endonuclease
VNATLSCPGEERQGAGAAGVLAGFRGEFYRCLTRRGDALFCLADAVLCGPRVTDLARVSLVAEFGRGHGAAYDALNAGRAELGRVRRALAGLPLPEWPDGRIRLAADVSGWLRPGAGTSPGRLPCHVPGRGRGGRGEVVPGWPYSVVAALGPGASSWVLPLDAVRIGPGDDDGEVTAGQLRGVVERLAAAGHWKPGDPEILIALDAGYNPGRLAYLLQGLPVIVVARVRGNRVFCRPAPQRPPGSPGRPPRHGEPVKCADPATWHGPAAVQHGSRARHGPLTATAWNRVHQRLTRQSLAWQDHPQGIPVPVIEGTLIQLSCDRGCCRAPMWLWASAPGAGDELVRDLWQCYLRRFDLEHMFRFFKQQLGWTRPLLRDPEAADRWTWLLVACYAQLWLARALAPLARMPWHPPRPAAGQLTPGQARAGFRLLRAATGTPAGVPKPSRPGPGRPKGSKNKRKAPRHPVGKAKPKTRKPPKKPRKKTKQTG